MRFSSGYSLGWLFLSTVLFPHVYVNVCNLGVLMCECKYVVCMKT